MLQNRVDPFGNLITTSARGHWMGNRGVIHNAEKQIVRPFKHRAWIICALQFNGRKRIVMTPNRWTELFFLDEATAFAAGHRPCFECRRPDAIRFKNAWIRGNPSVGFDLTTRIGRLDDVIHRERTGKVTPPTMRSAAEIPDGTFVVHDGEPYLVHREKIHQWTPSNYLTGIPFPDEKMQILTPMSIVNAFAAGYAPHVALH